MSFGNFQSFLKLTMTEELCKIALKNSTSVASVSQLRYTKNTVEGYRIMSSSTRMIHVRVDDKIKVQASETLEAMGLSVSEAVRLFLYKVVSEQALPFEVKTPNAKTRQAMREADKILQSQNARFETSDKLVKSLEKTKRKQASAITKKI